jgi:hypothetical protein
VAVDLSSEGLPSGTGVEVSAKRQTGGQRLTAPATLGNCTAQGQCSAAAVFTDLPAGAYFVESKASFQ